MAGTQFGGSAHAGDDKFGYYTASVAAPASPGRGPAGAFGGPYTSEPVGSTKSGVVWVALLVVIVVLIGAVVGGWWWRQRGRLVLPEQLGDMQRNTSSPYSKVMDTALAQATDQAGGSNKVVGALYGLDPKQETLLLVSRGPNVSAVQPSVLASAGLTAYGPDLCATAPKLVACVRTRGDLSVVVLAVRTGSGNAAVPPAIVAGWADEAWAAQ